MYNVCLDVVSWMPSLLSYVSFFGGWKLMRKQTIKEVKLIEEKKLLNMGLNAVDQGQSNRLTLAYETPFVLKSPEH